MATSKSLPSLVHFVRGFAAWAFLVFGQKTQIITKAGTQGTVLCVLTKHPNKYHGARS